MISTILNKFISDRKNEFDQIPTFRKNGLIVLSDFIKERLNQNQINLIFICTHNSRRSHLAQIWAQVAAFSYGHSNVHCYSGGTEVTALFSTISETLKIQGLEVNIIDQTDNPKYAIKGSNL